MSDSEPEEPQLKDTDDPFVGSDENQTTDNIPHTSSLFRNLIPLYTKVVDASDALEIDANSNFTFPEIVVIGGQSVGKSSVLESLVHKTFLPRGEGLVTRCPINLRLYQNPASRTGGSPQEWVEFEHDIKVPKTKYEFSKVAAEIVKRTSALAGKSKGIVSEPIIVSVYSPHVIPVSVIDLPGIVKNPVGEQPEDIEDQVNALIMEYISKPSTIILAISSANADIEGSDGIKMARGVDKSGDRTLAVITKLDLFAGDPTYLERFMTGKAIKTRYGFIAVRNPSEKELKKGISITDARAIEEKLLKDMFPGLADRNGTTFLAQKLTQLLTNNICKQLPQWEHQFTQKIKSLEERLLLLGSDDIPNKKKTMVTTITNFCDKFKAEFEGTARHINTSRLSAGPKVKLIFQDIFSQNLASVNPLDGITADMIYSAVLNSSSMESELSVPERAYKDLVKDQIRKLLQPSLNCVTEVHKELVKTIRVCLDAEIQFQFPLLTETLVGTVTNFLEERLIEVKQHLKYHIDVESSYIATSRTDFIRKMKSLMKLKDITDITSAKSLLQVTSGPQIHMGMDTKLSQESSNVHIDGSGETNGIQSSFLSDSDDESDKEEADMAPSNPVVGVVLGAAAKIAADKADSVLTEILNNKGKSSDQSSNMKDDCYIVENLIQNYFEIERQSLRDFVPKLITHAMICNTIDSLQTFLLEQLYQTKKINDLVKVSDEAQKERDYIRSSLAKLQSGQNALQVIRGMVNRVGP